MIVYIVIRRYCDYEGEWVDTLKVFKLSADAQSYAFTLNLENACTRTNFEVQEWGVV